MVQNDHVAAEDGLVLHIEHLIGMIRRRSGEAFLERAMVAAKLPYPWDRKSGWHVTLRDETELLRQVAELSDDPTYPARLGLGYSAVTSVPGYIARNSRTLGSAIQRSKRYTAYSAASLDYSLRKTSKCAVLQIWTLDPAADRNIVHREFGVFAVLSIMRYLVGVTLQPEEVTFRHRRSDAAEAIRRATGCSISWDRPHDSIRLRLELLDLPIPSYDPRLRDMLSNYGDTLLQRVQQNRESLQARVEQLILESFSDGAPAADQIASRLGMSRRTLTRRLSEHGLTYRQVLDNVRLDVAHSYLHDTKLSLAEISFQLGYADQAAFTTAYKRWTGKTPSHDRASAVH